MENWILYFCSCLSCFIIVSFFYGFADDRYSRTFSNRYIYIGTGWAMTFGIAAVNLLNRPVLNFLTWMAAVGLSAYILYYGDYERPVKRILDCEIFLGVITICESLGVGLADLLLEWMNIKIENSTMLVCVETAFSKIALIFLYFMAVSRLMKKRDVPLTGHQYFSSVVILLYTLVDIIVVIDNVRNRPNNYFLVLNLGCIVLADLHLLYLNKVMLEKSSLEYEVKLMEKQTDMQYKYYVRQEQNYNKTIHLLHDVDKHIKFIEKLYMSGNTAAAAEYTGQITDMLRPLIPAAYTGNPILDILITDYKSIMDARQIDFDITADHVNVDSMDAIDITTIFGNLFDNAIEACGAVEGNKKITLRLGAYRGMVSVKMENTCAAVKWKNGIPVSGKGRGHGMGLANVARSVEKYDGAVKVKAENGIFTVELFLNF